MSQPQEEPEPFHTDAKLNFYTHPSQDTVVALHALSKYGAITFARSQKTPLVTIQSSGTFSREFQIENSNRLLLQQAPLPDIPGDYDINVSGEGCVYAQVRFWDSWERPSPKWKVSLCLPAHIMLKLGEIDPRIQCNGGKYFYSLLVRQR